MQAPFVTFTDGALNMIVELEEKRSINAAKLIACLLQDARSKGQTRVEARMVKTCLTKAEEEIRATTRFGN